MAGTRALPGAARQSAGMSPMMANTMVAISMSFLISYTFRRQGVRINVEFPAPPDGKVIWTTLDILAIVTKWSSCITSYQMPVDRTTCYLHHM
jgi:hypothetical protein